MDVLQRQCNANTQRRPGWMFGTCIYWVCWEGTSITNTPSRCDFARDELTNRLWLPLFRTMQSFLDVSFQWRERNNGNRKYYRWRQGVS